MPVFYSIHFFVFAFYYNKTCIRWNFFIFTLFLTQLPSKSCIYFRIIIKWIITTKNISVFWKISRCNFFVLYFFVFNTISVSMNSLHFVSILSKIIYTNLWYYLHVTQFTETFKLVKQFLYYLCFLDLARQQMNRSVNWFPLKKSFKWSAR